MSINIALHNVSKVSAEVEHGETAHWVELKFEFKRITVYEKQPSPANLTVFFRAPWMADAFAAAVNSVNRPHVASNMDELRQQLRDCPENAEHAP